MRGDVAVVILAGGSGQRIGGGKPLKPLGGERLVDRALRQARSWSDTIAIAVRDPRQVQPIDAALIHDEPQFEGPLGGLIAALRFADNAGRDLLLAIPTDMPFLPRNLCDKLAQALAGHGCALASSGGHVHPVCALWRTASLDHVHPYVAGEDRSLKGFARAVGSIEVEWSIDPRDPFFNVNTAADLADAAIVQRRRMQP